VKQHELTNIERRDSWASCSSHRIRKRCCQLSSTVAS